MPTSVPWGGGWDTQGKAQRLEIIKLEPGKAEQLVFFNDKAQKEHKGIYQDISS